MMEQRMINVRSVAALAALMTAAPVPWACINNAPNPDYDTIIGRC
jgi:hypothetical protein